MSESQPTLSEAPGRPSMDARAMLREHGAFLKSLARALTRDPGAAEDLAQETLIEGLTRGADPTMRPRNERTWLATVLRRKAINRARSEGRRAARERRAARPEELEAPDVTVAQLEVGERLLSLLRELDEPIREAVTSRFYRGLTYPAIAKESGVPETTVKSRVERGLRILRAEMDRGHPGGRSAWLASLGGLVGAGRESAMPRSSVDGSLPEGMAWAVAATVVAAGVAVMWSGPTTPAEPREAPAPGAIAWEFRPGDADAEAGAEPTGIELRELGYGADGAGFDAADIPLEESASVAEEDPAALTKELARPKDRR